MKKIYLITALVLCLGWFTNAFAGTATVSWTANSEPDLAGYKIYYGTSARTCSTPGITGSSMCGYASTQTVVGATSYAFNNLTDGQTYYFSVSAYDTSNNYSAFSTEVNKLVPDSTAPTISAVTSGSLTTTGATITWTTNESADSQVEYGTSASYGSSTTLNTTMVTSHSVSLTGLTASTLYHYRVKSKDATGNPTTSVDYTFTTSAVSDTTAPTISSVVASSITQTGATITWTTNESSDSQVEYGLTSSYGSNTTLNTTMVTNHSVTLSGLTANTLYHFRVKSKDAANNTATSVDGTLTTSAPTSDVTAPTVPTGLSGSAASYSRINLSWTASTDAVGVVGYKIFRNGTQIATASGVSYADESVSASTSYSYTVSAYDAVGNTSSQSTSVSVTTSAVPAPPAGGGGGGGTTPPPAPAPVTPPSSGGGAPAVITPPATVSPSPTTPATPATTRAFVMTRSLYLGVRGTDVSDLQTFLFNKGFLTSNTSITGYYGTLTREAVRKFQCQNNIVCSGTESSTGYGIVGRLTGNAITQQSGGTSISSTTSDAERIKQLTDLLAALIKQVAELQARLNALRAGQ